MWFFFSSSSDTHLLFVFGLCYFRAAETNLHQFRDMNQPKLSTLDFMCNFPLHHCYTDVKCWEHFLLSVSKQKKMAMQHSQSTLLGTPFIPFTLENSLGSPLHRLHIVLETFSTMSTRHVPSLVRYTFMLLLFCQIPGDSHVLPEPALMAGEATVLYIDFITPISMKPVWNENCPYTMAIPAAWPTDTCRLDLWTHAAPADRWL